MKHFIAAILLFWGLAGMAKTCVLSLPVIDSVEDRMIKRVFTKAPDTDLFSQAQMDQIAACFVSDHYSDLVFISHGPPVLIDGSQYGAPILYLKSGQKMILPKRYFDNLFQKISQSRQTKIKTVRILFCGSSQSSLSEFVQKLSLAGSQIERAPQSKYSARVGYYVSEINLKWLSKSIKRELLTAWRTPYKNNCHSEAEDGCELDLADWVLPL